MSRVKVSYRSCSSACFKEFQAKHPNVKLTYRQFESIIYTYNKMFRDYVLETGDKFRMPHGFGDISIRKWKKKKILVDPNTGEEHVAMAIDWKRSKEEGKHVYIFNHHTDGFRFQWKWFRDTAIFENKKVFVFKPTRETSRKLAEIIKKNPQHYHKFREWPK